VIVFDTGSVLCMLATAASVDRAQFGVHGRATVIDDIGA
jgi:hypothetical protein